MTQDDFQILNVIGQGSFGKVFQVQKKEVGSIYAMKVLQKDHIIKNNAIKYIMRENGILKVLNHPFILKLKYSFQTKDLLFMVTDYLNGGEIFYHLSKEDYFTEERVKLYASQIILALSYLHENGIIYRDLKPENVLLDMNGNICLVDFGLCKTGMYNQVRTTTFCGSKEYLAPEMLEGGSYGKEVDWWALGVLLYEMIDGNPPFWDEDDEKMLSNILDVEPNFPDFFSEDCTDFISKLLKKDYKERLGYGNDSLIKIKRHKWFQNVDWVKVYKREIEPIFKPHTDNDDGLSNFDPMFTEQEPNLSFGDREGISSTVEDYFKGFSYIAPSFEWNQYREREKSAMRRKRKVSRAHRDPRDQLMLSEIKEENENNNGTQFDIDL